MKIHIIMPVISESMNNLIMRHLKKVATKDTKLSISTVDFGPISIESMYDEAYASKSIIEEVKKTTDVDGIIIYCFGNPAIEAVKEFLDIPVIGIGEAAQALSVPLCDYYGIITTVRNSVSRNRRKTKVLGLNEKLGAIIPLNLSVIELEQHNENLLNKIETIVKPYIDNQQIDLLHLGCGYLIGLAGEIQKRLGIPVVDPGLASVKMMESLIALNLKQSSLSYMSPSVKKRT